MGKHSKKVKCSVCNGAGQTMHSLDGRTVLITCAACNGTGQQP